MSYAGRPVKRSEDPRLLRGLCSFVDDIKLPGMLHACMVRSPYAHARILSVDASAAGSLHGVIAVLTGDGLAQGLGQALTEVVDYSPEGQPLNASFLDYGVPLARDMPEVRLGFTATASPTNPLGVRGGWGSCRRLPRRRR